MVNSSGGSRSWTASVVPVVALVVAAGAFGWLVGGAERSVPTPAPTVEVNMAPPPLAEAEDFGVLQWVSPMMDHAPWALELVNDTGSVAWFSVGVHNPIVRDQAEHFNMTKERVMVHYHVRADPLLGDAFVVHAQANMSMGSMGG